MRTKALYLLAKKKLQLDDVANYGDTILILIARTELRSGKAIRFDLQLVHKNEIIDFKDAFHAFLGSRLSFIANYGDFSSEANIHLTEEDDHKFELYKHFDNSNTDFLVLNHPSRFIVGQVQNEQIYRQMLSFVRDKNKVKRILTGINDLGLTYLEKGSKTLKKLGLNLRDAKSEIIVGPSAEYAFKVGKNILFDNYFRRESRTNIFKNIVRIPLGDENSILNLELDFTAIKNFTPRINLFVGKNGAGKSFAMKRAVEFLLNDEIHEGFLFNKIIVISNTTDDQYWKSSSQVDKFCRSPDLYYYFNLINSKACDPISGNKQILEGRIFTQILSHEINERSKFNKISLLLKYIRQIISFDAFAIGDKIEESLVILVPDFTEIDLYYALNNNNIDGDKIFFFKEGVQVQLSSGQKYFLKMILTLVSSIELNSIVFFDEPENFLHNELEVQFLHLLYKLLDETRSVAVIATHSGVIARESLSRHISHFKKDGDNYFITQPEIEIYANSLEKIHTYLFGDFEAQSPFKDHIESLAKKAKTLSGVTKMYKDDFDPDVLMKIALKVSQGK